MAITFTQEKTLLGQKKKQQYLILAFVGIVLITSAVLWFGVFKKSQPVAPIEGMPISPQTITINFGVLQNKIFDTLEKAPPKAQEPATIGRVNPFIPF